MRKAAIILLTMLTWFGQATVSSKTDERYSRLLDGSGWRMMRDTAAQWRSDRLYLPGEARRLSALPVNPPTGGWALLSAESGLAVTVPGTVEEYLTISERPQPQDFEGVSWWWRTIRVPREMQGLRVWLQFESVRQRAEVYIDGRLVAYDVVGESPFDADVTPFVRFGEAQQLAVRVTNAGGNFHWQDYQHQMWGQYEMPPGRSFSGIIGSVRLTCTPEVRIADLYMQNTLDAHRVNVVIEVVNPTASACRRNLELQVMEVGTDDCRVVWSGKLSKQTILPDTNLISIPITYQDARLWDIGSPNLYRCEVVLKEGKRTVDNDQRQFGFRSFAPSGIGSDAVLRLNGRRVMLRSAISWGYWPATGLYATDAMAERQVKAAQQLGLNMLNFHRCIGRPNVLQKADSLGLLYYEEPGGYQAAGHDPFIRAVVNEKLRRMIRRDRSHPSLVVYNMINEYGGSKAADTTLVRKRMDDLRRAHAQDPSRIITFTSGWATREDVDEDAKAHMRPFDQTLYRRGWFDNHRAGGPATWQQGYYRSPKDNYMYTDNRSEIYMRGEEGAISTPPRLQLIHDEISRTGLTGWDGRFWERQYLDFSKFFSEKGLARSFASPDSLCCLMGRVQLDHQGRRIQGMRMQNLGDVYVVNGWESMPYDNHSGIVDIYRHPKCDPQVMARYCQPLYVAVCPRQQVVRVPGQVAVDCYLVNEKNVRGSHTLRLYLRRPDGERSRVGEWTVSVAGGETYGQLLTEGVMVDVPASAGMYTIEAELDALATGHDEVLGVAWSADELQGCGAVYGGADDEVTRFYEQATGRQLQPFTADAPRLDWLVVNRSSLDEPEPIPDDRFQNLRLSWYRDNDLREKVGDEEATNIQRSFVAGAQPCGLLPANQTFSAAWEGDLVPTESGLHLIGLDATAGVRLWVDGIQLMDDYWNKRGHFVEARPVLMEAGRPVHIKVGYYQHGTEGTVQLRWARPGAIQIAPETVLDRARVDGTTVVILGQTETWMKAIAQATGISYDGYYTVGQNWVGGIHFASRHPLLAGLPQGVALDWPYQALVHDGDSRYGFHTSGEELVVGSYRSWPFHLGTAVGVVPYGCGRIIFSSLDISKNLCQPEGPAEVARRLFINMIK